MKNKKALIFLDLDFVIRHFVMNDTFLELSKKFDLTFVIVRDPSSDKQGIKLDISKLPIKDYVYFDIPRARSGKWFNLSQMLVFYNQRGTKNYATGRALIKGMVSPKLFRLFMIFSRPGLMQITRWFMLKKIGHYKPLDTFLNDQTPDLVLHPTVLTGFVINDLLQSCAALDIPLVLLMNSWDNPSMKAVAAGVPDRLVVWGDQTRRHAIEYMCIPENLVESFGAAQFQLYRTPETMSDSELRKLFEVPANLPIILYGGAGRGQHESEYIKRLDDMVETGQVPPCHILYRPHPWRGPLADGEVSFYDLNCKHVTMDPHLRGYYKRVVLGNGQDQFEMTNYSTTKQVLTLVSGVISPLSTILLESVMLGKPVLMYFPSDDLKKPMGRVTDISLKAAQFDDFWGSPGVHFCLEKDKFAEEFKLMLKEAGDPQVTKSLKEHASKFVVMDGPTYGERLATLADQLTNKRITQ